ncbi:MAG: hypothetical protein MN733_18500 [Nitrososphaera sp.]|nr:hypothetical protein [Nitrososphaera sp.]
MTKDDECYWVVINGPYSIYYSALLTPYTRRTVQDYDFAPVAAFKSKRAAEAAEKELNNIVNPWDFK